jgi:hypothetical protein
MSGSNSSAPGAPDRASPEPLALTVHTMPRLDADALSRRTAIGRLKMLGVLAVCAAPVIASYFTYFVIRPEGRTNYGTLILPTRSTPEALPLRTLAGDAVAARSLRGQWLLVSVGGGACDAACDKRLFMQRQLRLMLGKDRDRIDRVWLVADDAPVKPELQALLAEGEPAQVLRVPRAELTRWLEPEAGRTLDEHLYIVDPMGEWMMRTPAEPDPARVKRDLERLLRASSSWDSAGR